MSWSDWQDLRRKEMANTVELFPLETLAFDLQLKFIRDETRLKALFCTRRAAKSYTGGIYLIETALKNPGCNVLYIGLTRQSAHGIIWKDILRELDLKYNLKMRFNETLLTATLPNGSVIWVTGADTDEQEMNKLLGRKYKLCVLDEASMFTVNVHQLVYGILKPATADQRGTICLLGTSSNITRGLFYDITTGQEPGWSLHTWTAYDNPHVKKQWEEEIQDISANRPLFKETTLFRQWYLNEWCVDTDAKVYKYEDSANRANVLPLYQSPYHYVLGVDLGHFPDPSTFVIGAYNDESDLLYMVHAEKHHKMDITDVATKKRELELTYTFDVAVIDGANKQAVEELNNRHKCNFLPADKIGKEHFINLMNAEFIQKKILLLPGAMGLAEEYRTLVWETDGGKVKISATGARREHPGIPNDLCDAALYLWRWAYTYLWSRPKEDVEWNSQERWETDHIKAMQEDVRRKENPNHLDLDFDEGLFNFEADEQL